MAYWGFADVPCGRAERGSRARRVGPQLPSLMRVRAAEHAPRDPSASSSVVTASRRSSSVASVVSVERLCVHQSHLEREIITLSENASRHGHHFACE